MVKSLALHGVGLYIYAGEDPVATNENAAANDEPPKPTELPTPPREEVRRIGRTISGPQQAQIHKLVVETGTDLNRLLEHFGISKLTELPAAEFIRVVRSLEKRRTA